jgi:hypothetical protein
MSAVCTEAGHHCPSSSAWRESIVLPKLLATDEARPMTVNGQTVFAKLSKVVGRKEETIGGNEIEIDDCRLHQ